MTKALVILSGGQDSTTCLFHAIRKYGVENVHAITFDYGQRHAIELASAAKVATLAGIAEYVDVGEAGHDVIGRWEKIIVDNILHSTSPLTSDAKLDEYKDFASMEAEVGTKVEKTFVPMRNSLFVVIAYNRAVALGCDVIYTGICQGDNANYPDCTDNFRRHIELAMNSSLGKDAKFIQLRAPLMHLSKADTVRMAVELGSDCLKALSYSHTSYDGLYPPTGMNHSNVLRAKGFEEAGVPDPLVLRAASEGLMLLPATDNYTQEKVNVLHRLLGMGQE